MNFLQIMIACAIIAVGAFLMIKKARSKRAKKTSPIEPDKAILSPKPEEKEEKKKTWGQVIKMWWLIVIFGIPITYFLVLGMWGLVCKSVVKIYSSSHQISATLKWWKDDDVYGAHPGIRRGGPYDVKILRYDKGVMVFNVYYLSCPNATFKGEIESSRKFSGTWSQDHPENDCGNWYLVQNPNSKRLFEGKYTDRSNEWINFSLKIDPP